MRELITFLEGMGVLVYILFVLTFTIGLPVLIVLALFKYLGG